MSYFLQLSLNSERYIFSKISVLCCFQNIMIARCVAESTSKHCAAKCRFVTPVFGKYFTYFDPIGKTLFSWNNGLCMSRWKRSNTYSFICKRGCAEGHQWSGIFFPEKKKTNSKCADHVLGNCSGKRCKNLTIIFLQWAYKLKDNSPILGATNQARPFRHQWIR